MYLVAAWQHSSEVQTTVNGHSQSARGPISYSLDNISVENSYNEEHV